MSSSFLVAFFLVVNLHPYEAVEPHMGTLFRIKLYAAGQEEAQAAFRAAFARIAQLDDILSDYRPESELDRLSQIAVGHFVHVSTDLFRVIEDARELSIRTDGAFDITLGPLTHLWREARKRNQLPSPETIDLAKSKCGYRNLHLNGADQAVELAQSGMQLDAGGIAKGYAADEALVVISQLGIASALVAASGDLAFSNAPPGESGWSIGIDSFDKAKAPFTRQLRLQNAAVSTSGASEQFIESGGVHYSHIIDPAKGLGLTKNITATVVARRGIDADSLATAISVLGARRGIELIDRRAGCSALIVTVENGQVNIIASARFPAQSVPK